MYFFSFEGKKKKKRRRKISHNQNGATIDLVWTGGATIDLVWEDIFRLFYLEKQLLLVCEYSKSSCEKGKIVSLLYNWFILCL